MRAEVMYTIDLLKGQGVPIKDRPEGIAIVGAALAVPVIIAIGILGFYLRNSIVISIQKQRIANYETKIEELSEAVELQKSFERERDIINGSLSEVASSIGRHIQWSPILVELAKNMPNAVVLTGLEIKQSSVKKSVPSEDNPEEMVNVVVPVRRLQMGISGSPYSTRAGVVRDFRDRLRFSTLLGSKLEDIRVSQQADTLEGREVNSYEIDCIFKPGP